MERLNANDLKFITRYLHEKGKSLDLAKLDAFIKRYPNIEGVTEQYGNEKHIENGEMFNAEDAFKKLEARLKDENLI